MLRSLCFTAAAVSSAVVVIACAPPRSVRQPPQNLGATPLPTGDDPNSDASNGDDGDTDGAGATSTPIALSVTFREPGQHVILNVPAGDTVGHNHLVVAPGADVPQPFKLDDDAAEDALSASAHLDVDVADDASSIAVHADASFAADHEAYVVGQAGPLPIEVCATGDAATLSRVKIELVCDATLDVTGNGIAVLQASSGSGASTKSWCNFMNQDGDETLIPFTSPTHVEQLIDTTNGAGCWDVDVYAGANTGDRAAGNGGASATFTFTATDASSTPPSP